MQISNKPTMSCTLYIAMCCRWCDAAINKMDHRIEWKKQERCGRIRKDKPSRVLNIRKERNNSLFYSLTILVFHVLSSFRWYFQCKRPPRVHRQQFYLSPQFSPFVSFNQSAGPLGHCECVPVRARDRVSVCMRHINQFVSTIYDCTKWPIDRQIFQSKCRTFFYTS